MAGKGSSDAALMLDAMEILLFHSELHGFVLVTSDSDFTPLAMRLREVRICLYACLTDLLTVFLRVSLNVRLCLWERTRVCMFQPLSLLVQYFASLPRDCYVRTGNVDCQHKEAPCSCNPHDVHMPKTSVLKYVDGVDRTSRSFEFHNLCTMRIKLRR